MSWKIYSLDQIRSMAKSAVENPSVFWKDKANYISWFRKPEEIIEGNPPKDKWFVGGITNISYNAVDRHLPELRNKVAFYWVNENLDSKKVTYYDLYQEVNKASYVLSQLGVKKGDVVSLLMPSIPEAVYFSLAVHRLGAVLAIHYVGLSEETLSYRFNDCNSKVLVVASKAFRNGNEIRIKDFVDKVLDFHSTPLRKVLVISRGFSDFNVIGHRDVAYEDVKPKGKVFIKPEEVEANEPATIYYTSGTTGRPKGLYHTNGGYVIALNWAFRALFNPTENDTWWTISELGWPVWPMANLYVIPIMGLTGVLFEGYIANKRDLFSRIIEKFNVSLVWSSTTTLYTLKSLGEESVKGNTSSLREILNTGEPLNIGAWNWLNENLPNVRIADAYWMTEHLCPIAGTPYGLGEIPYKPGSAGIQFPSSYFLVVDDEGKQLPPKQKGYIVLKPLNPAEAKMWNDPNHEKLIEKYWSRFPGYFYTGDYGYVDEEGYLYVLGRADDVIKSETERIGTLEVESVIVSHPQVAEAAVIGQGSNIVAFVVPKQGVEPGDELRNDIKNYCRNAGYIVNRIVFIKKLPKTKSGKIMRRLLKAVVNDENPGDISTLDDAKILEELKEELKKSPFE
ncbi:AMP-binding protein [Acidianus sp. HS-5]|uniref:AMP-binding protein n=1 Tax=Acidianus sp. HS-5 TaxID=2886040 RepID=UPI001F26F87C|nr:AMP-binding protein [Acidianus sp. HS-5]